MDRQLIKGKTYFYKFKNPEKQLIVFRVFCLELLQKYP